MVSWRAFILGGMIDAGGRHSQTVLPGSGAGLKPVKPVDLFRDPAGNRFHPDGFGVLVGAAGYPEMPGFLLEDFPLPRMTNHRRGVFSGVTWTVSLTSTGRNELVR
jgi:hypothetical protein